MLDESKELLDFLQDIGEFAKKSNQKVYIVGGYVRDTIIGINSVNLNQYQPEVINPKVNLLDLDFLIEGDAIDFLNQYLSNNNLGSFNKSKVHILETFSAFKTVKVEIDEVNALLEFASSRTETYPQPAAFPKVKLGASIREDLPRRDFTINAILQSLMPDDFGEIIDYVQGIEDIKSKLIKVFHNDSFIDDPTRIYRAARFMAKFDFQIEKHTLNLMKEAVAHKDFGLWQQKRKGRFDIELDYIKELGEEQKNKALSFLQELLIKAK